MANIKQQKKRILTSEKARQRNAAIRSRVRTLMKQAYTALEDNSDTAPQAVKRAVSAVDRAKNKGVLHANSASRKKHSLMHAEALSKKGAPQG